MCFIIRKMQQEDKEEVLAMMRVFFDSPAVLHTSSDRVLERNVENGIGDCPYLDAYVFQWGKEIAGYAMVTFCYTTEYGGLCVWVEDLYLKPAYRGRGAGSEFLRFAEKQYPEAVRFKLEVEQENEKAVAVYQHNGYEISPYFEMTKEMTEG